MAGDPADRIIDLTVFVDTQVENVDSGRCMSNSQEDGIDAVLHIQIGFALLTIAQHLQFFRMVAQLFVEVKDMPVRVAFAENRDEPEKITLETEALAVSGDQAFARQFRSAIQ